MSKFKKSRWADSEFSQNYRDEADIYLPFRSQFIKVTKALYGHYISKNIETSILDLGCGDGLFIQELSKSFPTVKATLVDGSSEMLTAAQNRLVSNTNLNFINVSFQELLTNDIISENFNFIYSSLAVHHLSFEEKKNLYAYIYKHLSLGGFFVNYDVTVPPSEELERWYLSLWRQWIRNHLDKKNGESLIGIPEQYKGNPDNTPDTLASQLDALKDIGYKNVDCFFKYGIFVLFGGSK